MKEDLPKSGFYQHLPASHLEVSIGKQSGIGEVDDLIRWAKELPDDI
jgi:hypothetical protein